MAAASGVSARIWTEQVPVLPAARAYVQKGIAPGGTHANRRFLASWVSYEPEVTDNDQLLLCDAQTSGGLLAALPSDQASDVVRELQRAGTSAAAVVGSIEAGAAGRIHVGTAKRSDAPPKK
jgi:selenide,water dikinase